MPSRLAPLPFAALRLALPLLSLAACAAPPPAPVKAKLEVRPAGALRSTDADSATCLSQGHPVGTDDYARCLLRLAEQRRGGGGWRGAAPEETLKIGDWCWAVTSPDPFRCLDI